jgi:hypothetical protein
MLSCTDCCLFVDESTERFLETVSEDIRSRLTGRLGPIPPLSFVKDIHYNPASKLEHLMAKTGLPKEPEADTEALVEELLVDLRLEADAADLRRDAILKVIDLAATRSRADHRSEPDREQANHFSEVGLMISISLAVMFRWLSKKFLFEKINSLRITSFEFVTSFFAG